MNKQLPRVVLVTRPTPLDEFLERFGTRGQVEFFLRTQGHSLAPYQDAHDRFASSLAEVVAAIPAEQRRVRVDRADLDRFIFAPDDVVVVIGQDGLVANVAKYLDQQLVVGVNSDPQRFDGVLCKHQPRDLPGILRSTFEGSGQLVVEHRAMAQASRSDGSAIVALNEIFVGHRTHQSARYRLTVRGREERQSSSGLIIATGTGATGWARSIARQRGIATLPAPQEPRLAWFVREPFPSIATGTELDHGVLSPGESLRLTSEMGTGGVLFADGIESDWVDFLDGHNVDVQLASRMLHLVADCHAATEDRPQSYSTSWVDDAA